MSARERSERFNLALSTLTFAICFAAWGLLSPAARPLQQQYQLSDSETALLLAMPVLLGAIARLPAGILTDRVGTRPVFAVLLLVPAGALLALPAAASLPALLTVGFFLGLAGASFASGIAHVSRWTPASRQGVALGVFGVGNIGQSAAVFLAPVLAERVGWNPVFRGVAVLLIVWTVVYALLARDAPAEGPPRSFAEVAAALREPLAWLLSAFYFLTFGGFVACGIYLPKLLGQEFGLSPTDAGFRAAGFVVLATVVRPLGGWLADRLGGARVLALTFFGLVPFALLLGWLSIVPFTVGALGCATLLGLGNGAVFKLVPQYFPDRTGTVTGLVGAMGGLGGFFPPLLLGICRQHLGTPAPAFLLLALCAAALGVANQRVFLVREQAIEAVWPAAMRRRADQLLAATWATLLSAMLVAAIVVGSRNLENFDPALVIYTFAVVFAFWGVVYHYRVWLQKPPTRVYWERGWQLLRQHGLGPSCALLARVAVSHLGVQGFIGRRSRLRWAMHQCLFWGCLLAAAVTFPLVFGWIHFASVPSLPDWYVAHVFGFPTIRFWAESPLGFLMFHALDISAVLVLAGIALSLLRRLRDAGAQAVQEYTQDFLPLIILFAISVTGLALTASTTWLRGAFYPFLAILHAVCVIGGLLYLPFGKFFHIFQRPAQLGVKLYQQVGETSEGAHCVRCGERFASAMQIGDLRGILPELGFDYTLDDDGRAWVDVCPACKRKSLALAQMRIKESARGA